MPKLKKKLSGNFTIINNTVLRDKRMGCTERGAYVTLVSMADDWNFSIRGLAAIMPDGVTKISGALKRLETLGKRTMVLFLFLQLENGLNNMATAFLLKILGIIKAAQTLIKVLKMY